MDDVSSILKGTQKIIETEINFRKFFIKEENPHLQFIFMNCLSSAYFICFLQLGHIFIREFIYINLLIIFNNPCILNLYTKQFFNNYVI